MASNLDIFELKCLLQNINIKLCARIESGVKQLLALVTHNSDIILHYSFGELPVVLKRIPWYASKSRFIQAICFDPTATWLLVICADGSLHIVPFLSLVDKKQKVDCKWSTTDLTHFPKPQQTPDRKPTAVVWWQTLDSNQNGLIGYEDGTIALISLTDGRCLGTCSVNEAITELNLCQDNSLDAIFLLINGVSGKQWKHILEQHSMGYVWPPELANHTDDSTQSRLSSLRQLGVDKLVSLRQRLVEGRNSKKDNSSDTTSESSLQSDSSHSGPELIPHLPQTHFSPQYARDRYLFSTFYKPTCLVTVHAADVEAAPLYTHKLPTGTEDFLLTDKLIFTLSSHKKTISIVSSNLSECLRDCDSEFNIDALVARFSIDNEHILKIYKLADLSAVRLRKCRDDKRDKLFEMPKTVDDLNIRKIRIDTCVLVTSKAVYKINVSISPIEKFVQHIVRESDYDKAERLADIFGLNVQQLLEGCGDLLISRGSFHSGIILYKQAKVHLLKRVLKLAISADCKTLLKFVHLCLSASKVDMSVATKIHIGNLAVMAYTELILRYGGSTRISNTKDFMNFLRYEGFYDQILAVNVACQAAHWKIVNLLARTRGLQPEVVSAFGQILHSARAPRPTDLDFIYSLSEPSLTQSLLLSPKSAEIIFQYIRANVEVFPIDILKRFILQLDPSQPCAIPLVARKFQTHKSSLSLESTLDSSDCDYHDEDSTVVKDMIETFIIVLVHLISKTDENSYKLLYLERIKVSHETILEPSLTKFPDIQPLNCGYEHAAIVRNDLVYTMGVSSSGCLGLGPLLSQSSPARLVQTLADLKVRVISVSCGRKHTLFLTDYGVYSCGSNNYGQLGLGHSVQECPYPQLLSDLSAVKIVQVVCGQYHSMALTSDGKVYTWGWGIHGQLGHGGCSNESHPRRLNFSKKVKQVTAGHAHSLILTLDGELFGFGSNAFGQLESSHGGANKYSNPMRIHIMPQLLTPIEKVSSAYFHNIAILEDQEVYTWGASPQEVRLVQAKNHHKANGISTKPPESWKISVNVYSGSNRGPIDQISIGYRHTVILHNGKMLWGKNKDDDLSPPHLRDQDTLNIFNYRFLHVSCGFDYTMAVDHIGRLLAWGSVSMAQVKFILHL
ncbi:hypothetical protein HHI36_009006 [Cryptolaemus montrouzieri]|uniref:RCC1-like domain-containing protein n=1 Tax=Cryptolaemus montrouzieri TaxID=559131 RepID=A0ABD2MUL1_9CUCU